MPRALDPASLAPGGGLAARRSVEASAFVHPTQGLDGLVAHIGDPSRAHMASAVGIVDAGGYFASDEVEGALQEVASSAGSTGQNGVVEGGTYVAAGLGITLASPTTVRVNGTDRDLSGATTTLADNATSWLYVDGSTGALTSAGSVPSITSPENVLLAKVTTLAGSVTASRDARWFVRNLDRKLPLTVRASGTAADRNSEASFESIDAAVLYLENFGSGVMRTFTLVVKGPLTVSSTVVIPVDGVTLQGEDGCVLTTGGSLAPMIDVSGRSGVRVRDIRFVAAHAGSTAIACPSNGVITDVVVERCSFKSGASAWVSAVDFDVAGPQSRCVVQDCDVTASAYGVKMREPQSSRIQDVVIGESGSAGVLGFHLGRVGGAVGTTSDSYASGVQVKGFGLGGLVRGSRMKVLSCSLQDSDSGLLVSTNSDDVVVADSTVLLDATTGVTGIGVDADNVRITGCRIRNQRAGGAYVAELPVGIDLATGSDGVLIADCQVENFLNTVTPGGVGIRFAGTSTGSTLEACTVSTTDVGILATGPTAKVQVVGCTVIDAKVGMSVAADTVVTGSRISLDSTRALVGIDVTGSGVQISGGVISNPRSAASYGGGDVPAGIRIGAAKVTVSDVDVSGFYNSVGPAGSFVLVTGAFSNVEVSGGSMDTAWTGLDLGAGAGHLVSGVSLSNFQTGIAAGGAGTVVTGCVLAASSTYGVAGVVASGTDTLVTGCKVTSARTVFAGEDPVGISLNGQNAKVTGCLLRGWRNSAGTLGTACSVLSGASRVTFQGNTVENCWSGFFTDDAAAADEVLVEGCTFRDIDLDPIFLTNSDQVRVSGNTVTNGGSTFGIHVTNSADVEITSNRVMGGASTPAGIRLEGASSAGDQARRFVVSGNIVTSCTEDGILLTGYVQNGVVSGNTVDNYLPAAQYDPTANACIRLASGGGNNLVKFVEVVGNTCLRAKNGIVLTGIDATTLSESVSIRGNTVHHCGLASGGTTTCAGISATWTRNLQVLDNNVYRVGKGINDSDVEGDPTAGANVWPIGVLVVNSTATQVRGNAVSDLNAVGAAYAIGAHFQVIDTVSAFDVRNVAITDNTFITRDSLPAMGFGIVAAVGQASGGSGATTTVLGLEVSHNVLRRIDDAAISVACNGGCTMQQVAVTQNVVSQCVDGTLGRGVWVSAVAGTAFADGILREVDILGNTIGNAGDSGIRVDSGDGCTLTTVSIRGNSVADSGDHGIEVAVDLTPAAVSAISVDDNTIVGAANEAIFFSVTDFAPSNLSFCRNAVYGANGGAALGQGLHLVTIRSAVDVNDVTGLTISGNRVHTATSAGLFVNLDGALHDAIIADNLVEVNASGSPLQVTCDPVNTVGVETYVENVTVSGNTLVGGSAASLTVDHGLKLRNVSFTGNVRRTSSTQGVNVTVSNATVGSGDAVSGLTFSGNVFDGTTAEAVRLFIGDAVTEIDPCVGISVVGNQFTNCNSSGVDDRVVHLRGLATIRDVLIADNTFGSCGSTSDEGTGNVDVRLGVNGPGDAGRNISVVGNVFENCQGVGVHVRDHAAAATCSILNTRVSGNQFYSQSNDAVRLNYAAVATIMNVLVADNVVQRVSNGGVTSDTGISFFGSSSFPTYQVTIRDNVVRTTGSNNVEGGIQAIFQDDVNDLVIDNNSVADCSGNIAGIYVGVDGLWLGGSVSGNVVSTPVNDGIHLEATGIDAGTTGIRGVVVANNRVTAAGNDGIATSSAVAASTPVLDNLVVSGNVVESPTGYGIFVAGEVLTTVSVTGNTVRAAAGDDGIRVSSNGDGTGLTVSGNTVVSADKHGIAVIVLDNTFGLTVSGNVVSEWSTDAAGVAYGGVYLELASANTELAQSIVVSGNALNATQTWAIGYWFAMKAAVAGLVVSNNTVDLHNQGDTTSHLFAASTGSQVGVSYTGNSFRRAQTGVSYSGSFAPDRSQCSVNVERTTNGAGSGNWGTGGPGTFTFAFTNSTTVSNQD
jgi:parallel beta-helix repeat protein